MHSNGVVPVDAPDPSIAAEARIRALPYPVIELQPQPAVTRAPIPGVMESSGASGVEASSVSFTYTLWRHPEDHADPRNEIELDERLRQSIEDEPPWGRPTWLIEQAQIFRYPMLWEAVRTAWHASPGHPRASLPSQLVDHTNAVLRNRFREELGIPAGPGGGDAWKVTPTAVTSASATVDGDQVPAIQIDTDPFVYAIGFRLTDHVVGTAVLPRDALPYLRLEFSRR